jgi:hypothetical protein
MFETAIKSAAELGKPATILLVGGTQDQRTKWADNNLMVGPLEIISLDFVGSTGQHPNVLPHHVISCRRDEAPTTVRGLTLAGAVIFTGTETLDDCLRRSILNSLITVAQHINWHPNELIHYVDSATKYCSSCERPDFNDHDRGCPDDRDTQVHSTNPGTGAVTLTDDDIKELRAWPPTGLFRHTDGGIYEVLMGAQSSTDQSLIVVYKHRWPFDVSIWTRPFKEWDRFTPITQQQFDKIAQSMDRQAMQQLITLRRTARKSKRKTDDPTQPVATIRRWCSGDAEWSNWQLADKESAVHRSTDPSFQVLYLDTPLPIPA